MKSARSGQWNGRFQRVEETRCGTADMTPERALLPIKNKG